LKDEEEQRKKENYFASILWSIGKMIGGENYPFPVYDDYMHGIKQDNRSSEDIISGLIDKLT